MKHVRHLTPTVLLALLGLTALACGPQAHAQGGALYVDAGGHGATCSDGRGAAEAQNPLTPLCTIPRAIAVAPDGGRIIVRGGSYPALDVAGGSRSTWLTIAAEAGEAVTLPSVRLRDDAGWLRFEGLRLTGPGSPVSIAEGGSHHIAVVNSDIRNGGGGDLVSIGAGSSAVLVEGNYLSGGGEGVAWVADQTTAAITDVTVRNNHFDTIGTDALRPANFDGALVEGNEIEGVAENGDHSDALQSYAGGRNLVFRGNYVHDNNAEGFFVKDGHVDNVVLENNVFVNNRGAAAQVKLYDTTGLRIVNNTVWNNQANVVLSSGLRDVEIRNNLLEHLDADATVANVVQERNVIGGTYGWRIAPTDVRGAPAFVDAAARDYRLAPGSAGIDMATSAGAPAADKACRARWDDPAVANTGPGSPPFIDAGALERSPDSTARDTAARAGCASAAPPAAPGPSGGAGGGPGTTPGARCTVAAGAVRRASLRLRSTGVRKGRLRFAVRVRRACAVRFAGTARWRAGSRARRAKLKPTVVRVRPGKVRRVALRLPKRALRAVRAHRRVTFRLRVRASAAGARHGFTRTIRIRRR
jgi:hypothetical protein